MMLGIFSFFIDFGSSIDYRLIGGVLLASLILSLSALSLALSDENDLSKALEQDLWKKNKTGSDFEEIECPNITADNTELSKEILALYEELGCGNITEIEEKTALNNNGSILSQYFRGLKNRVKRKASKPRTFSGIRSTSFFRTSYRKYQFNSNYRYSKFGNSKEMYAYKYNGYYYYRAGAKGNIIFSTRVFKAGSYRYLTRDSAETLKSRLKIIAFISVIAILLESAGLVAYIKSDYAKINRVEIM